MNPTDSLKSNSTYELDFNIYSALRGDFVDDDEVKDPKLTFTSFDNTTETLMPTGFAIDMGTNWKADFDDLVINFKWDSVSGAEYYQIFAKDNRLNTDFIVVNPYIEDISFWTMQGGTVNFAADDSSNISFDLYFDDMGLHTPFSGGTEITFKVRAVNSAGPSPFSAEITIADETAPTYTVIQTETADNTAGTDAATFTVAITEDEYLSTIAFAFAEMGGDPAYVLTPADVAWTWEVDMRHGAGVVTVPIGACASADNMIVTITDNSGNVGVDTLDLRPYIVFVEPTAASTEFEAPTPAVEWTIHDVADGPISSGTLDLYWSDNSGVDWLDSDLSWKAWNASPTTWTAFDTVYSTTFMLGLGDHDGGWIWKSDVFNYTGIDVTGPDSTWLDDGLFYDREGVDSTGVPLTWAYAGLDSVAIQYNVNGGAWATFEIVTVTGGTGTYDFYAPDTGADYVCNVRVADWDGDSRPNDNIAWTFDVTHDWVNITAPIAGEMVAGGSLYDVTW
ncbi:MAG: hypothetical protein KAW46_09190, partial [candidate division Zixibacteria bacterium]|nr:hypothetical protein [candidate division Zixibacteria bacterium]